MNNSLQTLFGKRGFAYGVFAGLGAAMLLFLMARALLDHAPLYDELLHYLAAQGLLQTGEPVIADGVYTRAWLYTYLVAGSFSVSGETLVAARMPALVAGLCLPIVLSLWVTRRAGLLAGATAALCVCLLPETVALAVFARFYTLHALIVVVMAIMVYEAVDQQRTLAMRAVLVVMALGLAVLALHFQETTVIGAGALTCGAASLVIFDRWAWVSGFIRRYPLPVIVGIGVALVIGLLLMSKAGVLDKMGQTPLWNEWAAGMPHYYLTAFAEEMPLLWPLYPVAIGIALLTHPRLTVFATVVFVSGLAVHSIAAAKSLRYAYYLLPYFCVVWGCALSGACELVRGAMKRAWRISDSRAGLAALAMLGLVLAGSLEGQGAAKLVAGKENLQDFGLDSIAEPDWSPIVPVLAPMLPNAARVVTSNAMKSLYYLGRYDYELNASIVPETDTGMEFGADIRTGRQAIGTAESIGKVIAMPGTTLVMLEVKKIGADVGAPEEAMQVITSQCRAIDLPVDVAVRAWTCSG